MKFDEVETILTDAGFQEVRTKGSHRHYQGFVGDRRRLVTLAPHSWGDDILPKTLASVIR